MTGLTGLTGLTTLPRVPGLHPRLTLPHHDGADQADVPVVAGQEVSPSIIPYYYI